MTMRPLLLYAALGLTALAGVQAFPADARSRVDIDVGVNVAPPPPRYERVYVRPGYAWVPGYWRWNGYGYIWVDGYYMNERPGYVYVGPSWHAYYGAGWRGPHWRMHDGYWVPRHRW